MEVGKKIKNFGTLLLIIIVGFYAARALIGRGFVPTHDAEYHIIRLWQFDKVIQTGEFIPRWAPDLDFGYGVPLFSFFYPLPNYIGELFHSAGFSFIRSVHLTLAGALVVSGVAMYLWCRRFFGTWSSLSGAVMYMLGPYALLDVLVRGSVGEAWALALTPLFLWAVTGLAYSRKKNRSLWLGTGATALGLLLLSHNLLGPTFAVLSAGYSILLYAEGVYGKKPERSQTAFALLGCYGLGVALASFFWLPVMAESSYITGLFSVSVLDHFPALYQLVFPSWGTGLSVPGISDQMSFQIGIPHLFALISAGIIAVIKRSWFVLWIIFLVLVTCAFMLEFSAPVWEAITPLQLFQFPWRLLSVVLLAVSFCAAYVADRKPLIFAPAFIIGAFVFYGPYTSAVVYEPREDSRYLESSSWINGTATLGNSFHTKWYTNRPERIFSRFEIEQGEGKLYLKESKPTRYRIEAEASTPLSVLARISYFPGWTFLEDGKAMPFDADEQGIHVSVPRGNHSIMVVFDDTLIRRIGEMLSLTAVIVIGRLFFRHYDYSNP